MRTPVTFSERVLSDDGTGNRQATWIDRLTCAAQIIPERASEVVDARRLEGRGVVVIRVRNFRGTRQITTDWPLFCGPFCHLKAKWEGV